jgi:membrane protease YdiL (CAAX protease family)
MLSERPWHVDAVLRLLAGLLVGQFATAVVSAMISKMGGGKAILNDRLLQFVVNTFTFHAIALVLLHFFLRYHGVGWRVLLGLNQFRPRMLALGITGALLILPLALGLNTMAAFILTRLHLQPAEQASMQALQLSVTLGQKIVFGLAAIVVAPIIEESIFRGIFYPTIKQQGYPRMALFGSSFLFASIHLNLMTFIPLFVLALLFVYLLEKTDSLLTSISAHSCFNAANFIIFLNRDEVTGLWDRIWGGVRNLLG